MTNQAPVLTLDSVVSRNEKKFLSSRIGEETVMMDIDTGDYIGINNVGSDIWNRLEQPVSVRDIIGFLTGAYDVSPEQCEKETFEYLQKMQQHEMLLTSQ